MILCLVVCFLTASLGLYFLFLSVLLFVCFLGALLVVFRLDISLPISVIGEVTPHYLELLFTQVYCLLHPIPCKRFCLHPTANLTLFPYSLFTPDVLLFVLGIISSPFLHRKLQKLLYIFVRHLLIVIFVIFLLTIICTMLIYIILFTISEI